MSKSESSSSHSGDAVMPHPACALLGPNMEVQSVNRAWRHLSGYFTEAVIGQPFLSLIDDPTGLGLRVNVKSNPTSINALPLVLKRNPLEFPPETVPISLTMHPLYQESEGQPVGYLAVATPVCNDIVMGNLGGVWLEPSEFVGHLVRGTAHKLNNLVTVFQGYTDMLLLGDPEPEELKEALAQMASASGGLVEIINRLLDVGGRASLDLRECEASELTENLLRLSAPYRGENIQFEMEIPPDLPKVFVDPKRVEQAIVELVRNGCDAIDGHGLIRVVFRREGSFLTISVFDSGPGFTEVERTCMFRPFYTTKRAFGRLGIGLNAVTGLLSQMHGELHARCGQEHGTEFRMILPEVKGKAAS